MPEPPMNPRLLWLTVAIGGFGVALLIALSGALS